MDTPNLNFDGRLCHFASTGISLIAFGHVISSSTCQRRISGVDGTTPLMERRGIQKSNVRKEKYLKFYFLNKILEKMNVESECFLNKVRQVLLIQDSSLALASLTWLKEFMKQSVGESNKESMEKLQQVEYVFQFVEEDFSANLGTLHEQWDRREADGGAEQPRWTRNDEEKYRTTINKLCVEVERAAGKLKTNQNECHKLKEFLAALHFIQGVEGHEMLGDSKHPCPPRMIGEQNWTGMNSQIRHASPHS